MSHTLRELIHLSCDSMTRSDQKIARTILANYPTEALKTISELAELASVSDPSVIRFVKRLGFSGYPQFQQRVRQEIGESLNTAVNASQAAPATSHLPVYAADYIEQIRTDLKRTLNAVQTSEIEGASRLLAAPSHRIFLMSDSDNEPNLMAFQRGLFSLRSNCVRLESDPLMRSNALMGINKNDIIVAFQRKPYDVSSMNFCRLAVERGAQLIVFVDDITMPLADIARYLFCAVGAATSSLSSMCLADIVLLGTKQTMGHSAHTNLPGLHPIDLIDPNPKLAT